MTDVPQSPYKGLRPFDDSDADALLFFGRARESEVIAANLLAARLTVLYGPSGVGKSSVLRAGVARRLRSLAEQPLVVVFSDWAEAPGAALSALVATAAGVDERDSLADTLGAAVAARGEVYVILDQAEELFLYDGDAFVGELPALVNSEDLHSHVLLSVRDDALAQLDVFKRRIPDVFGNYLRLDRLDRDAARSAIVGPLERFNELVPGANASIEPALVDAVLDEVGEGRIEQGLGGVATVPGDLDRRRIETPYLQLVLERLWEVERDDGSARLRLETLRRLGGAQRIVAEHLEDALAGLPREQRDLAASLFNHLVTPSGSKIAHRLDDLEGYTGAPSERLAPILGVLAERRVLRTVAEGNGGARYEIFHDVLGSAVVAWRTRHEAERRLDAEREVAARRQRRLTLLAAAALAAFAVVAGIAVYALSQRSEAREQARAAAARELTSAALLELDLHPELAVLLAREAVLRDPTPSGEHALRRSLIAFKALRARKVGAPVVAVAAARRALLAVGADGVLHVGEVSTRLAGSARAAAFDPAARRVAIADGETVRVHEVATGAELLELGSAPTQPRLALDGEHLVVAAGDGRVRVVSLASGDDVARLRVPRGPSSVAVATGLVAVTNGHVARVFDVARSRAIARIEDRATLRASALAPDGSSLVTGAADSAVRIWELPSGDLANVLLGHRNHVTAAAFTPDATRLVTASMEAARVWEVETARSLGVLAGHDAAVTAVAASPDSRLAATGSADRTVRTWDALGDPHLPLLARLDRPAAELVVGRRGLVAVTDAGAVRVDVRSGALVRVERPAPSTPFRLEGSEVRYRNAAGREIVLRGHDGAVTSARYSADRTRVVTASRDADVRIWDAASGALVHVLAGHFAAVVDASFSPDGRRVVSAGPITAGLWDVGSGELLLYLRGHEGLLTAAAFADDRTVVTAGEDRTLRVYRCELCGDADALVRLADRRLRAIGRTLTPAERRRYLDD